MNEAAAVTAQTMHSTAYWAEFFFYGIGWVTNIALTDVHYKVKHMEQVRLECFAI